MSAFNLSHRRRTATQFADHAEACEVRVLLSGIAIYPQQDVVKETTSVAPTGKVSPLVQTPADYNGTWDTNQDTTFNLSVTGDNTETGKVKGTASSPGFLGGTLKFKGKISNEIQLEGKFHGKIILGPVISKFKLEVSAELTDSTHMAGVFHVFIKGSPQQDVPFTGTRI